MKRVRMFSVCSMLLAGAILASGCATTQHRFSPHPEMKAAEDDKTRGQKFADIFLGLLTGIAYGLAQSGASFAP
jgi:hypothetical protein